MGVLDVPFGSSLKRAGLGPIPPNRCSWYGTSYVFGSQLIDPMTRFSTIVAYELGLREINRGIGSSELAGTSVIASSGIGTVFVNETAANRNIVAAPFKAPNALICTCWGINDALGGTVATPNVSAAVYADACRVAWSRFRSYFIAEHGHASVVLGGAGVWTSGTTVNGNASGNDYSANPTVGSTVTINVPSWFPGGGIALGVLATSDATGAFVNAADWSITVDGGAASTLITRKPGVLKAVPPGFNQHVFRTGVLAAGAHTIVMTTTAVTGEARFDYWQAEEPAPGPTIAHGLCARLPEVGADVYANRTLAEHDALILAQNVAVRALRLAEFADTRLVLPELDLAIARDPLLFFFDGVHPNHLGAPVIADCYLKEIRAV